MFRLLNSSRLRRNELLYLKIEDIIATDGRNRLRINKGNGGKDRYTVLSELVLSQLREYFKAYRPVTYLFNGREPGERMRPADLRHAMSEAAKKAGITRNINLHILRHCFASHALEEGMNIKTLQYLMGRSSVHTTMVYLHVSEVPPGEGLQPAGQMGKAIMATMADVMRQFSAAYIKNCPTSQQQLRLVHDNLACRTQQPGKHTSSCSDCGEVKVHYNSCCNRGCPSCQGTNKEKWMLKRTMTCCR